MRRSALLSALVAAVLAALLLAPRVRADFDVRVTAPEGFADGLTRVLVLAVECDESVDCGQVEERTVTELRRLHPGFEVVAPERLRRALFALGRTAYAEDVRGRLIEELEVDGILEVRIPFGNRGDGFGGRRRSEARVELRLVSPDGTLRMSGDGTGRPKNVVSGTERVAGTVIEKILAEAFGKR